MAPEQDGAKFFRVVSERLASRVEPEATSAPPPAKYADLAPEEQFERSEESTEMDRIISGISVVDAYVRWCGKMRPVVRPGQKESVMISCPIPGHADKNPSAWLNTEKNVWHCAACERGGDVLDLAAFKFGMTNYKEGANFVELRRRIVKDLGYVIQKLSDGTDHPYLPPPVAPVAPVEPAPVTPPVVEVAVEEVKPEVSVEPPAPVAVVEAPLAKVVSIVDGSTITGVEEEIEDLFLPAHFDWRKVVTQGTFLDTYMGCAVIDDCPEEFHFWNGMILVGLAAGRSITLRDLQPVYANLFLCLIGKTGERKSRSLRVAKQLLRTAAPWLRDALTGIPIIQGVASGEQLIATFDQTLMDTTGSKPIPLYKVPISGLIEYGELEDLTSRTSRIGSTLKTVLMQFADADDVIATDSVTHGAKEAENALGSMFTTTQPESLKNLLQEHDTTSGFLNRWVFATGKPKRKYSLGGITVDITPAVDPYKELLGQPPRQIGWTKEAAELWDWHFHETLEKIKPGEPLLARIDLIEKKLALILAINEGLNEVTTEIVTKVFILHEYLVKTFGITSEGIQKKSQTYEIREEIIRHLRRLSNTPRFKLYGPTKRAVKDCLKRKEWNQLIVDKVFDMVIKEDSIQVNYGDESKPGPKTEHYRWVG